MQNDVQKRTREFEKKVKWLRDEPLILIMVSLGRARSRDE